MNTEIESYIADARWFGGKGRDFSLAQSRRLAILATGQPAVAVDLLTIEYADGETETYQLPISCYSEPQHRLEHARIAAWDDGDFGPVTVYDAVHDRDAMAHYLHAFGSGERNDLVFHRVPGHDLDIDAHSTPFTGEQSNSSVMFGEDAVLKIFRKVTPGENPDITVHEALTRAGSEDIAQLYGWVSSGDLHLAMLQEFLRTASDGWETALASVRNLYAEGDLHADEVGGDFAAEASRLGQALADVHRTLAEQFPTGTRDLAGLAAAMRDRLAAAVEVVPQLAEDREHLQATYAALESLGDQPVQRIHGDLHLGQTLRTATGWKIVDFEGEPAKALEERTAPDSRWRDVAGMLRSFGYAPSVVARTLGEVSDDVAHQRQVRAVEWTERNSGAFLAAYAGPEGLSEDEERLLAAYVADKAVYECVYEARNRPSWVAIPLAAIKGLNR